MGILFKTHGVICSSLIQELIQNILPQALASSEKQKTKFGLFVMDDMVEFLGPDLLGPLYYTEIAKKIISYCSSPTAAVR
jgi:hypothetical protein